MYTVRLPLAYYNKVDAHGDKFSLSSFKYLLKNSKKQLPIFLGHRLQMKYLSGGAKEFQIDTKNKALTALLTVGLEAETLLKKDGIARLTGVILQFQKTKTARTIKEFKAFEVIILPKGLDVYNRKRKTGKGLKRLLKNKDESSKTGRKRA